MYQNYLETVLNCFQSVLYVDYTAVIGK